MPWIPPHLEPPGLPGYDDLERPSYGHYHVEVVEVGDMPPQGGAYCASTHSRMTDEQRSLAQDAHVASSVDDLQERVSGLAHFDVDQTRLITISCDKPSHWGCRQGSNM